MDITTGWVATSDADWVPDACALPTAEQPLRVAEFDEFFASAVRTVERIDATTLLLAFDAAAIDQARDLAARETECCSFFGFEVTGESPATAIMQITVPPARSAILDAVSARAASRAPAPEDF